jgi:hypothetical protein
VSGKTTVGNCAYAGRVRVWLAKLSGSLNSAWTRNSARFVATKLSMIVVITSFASAYAFSAPGIAAYNPPKTAPVSTPSGRSTSVPTTPDTACEAA